MAFDFNPNILRTRDVEPPGQSEAVGIDVRRDIGGGTDTVRVVKKLGHAISIYTARIVANIVADLLAEAQPRVPLQPDWEDWPDDLQLRFPEKAGVVGGRLRESGRAELTFEGKYAKQVGRGHKDGSVTIDTARITQRDVKGAHAISGTVTYTRWNKDKDDIALWTHENILPYGSTKRPKARTPGTGPKYLEIPWKQNEREYIAYFKSELAGAKLDRSLNKILISKRKKIAGETFSFVDIVLDRIALTGYY